MDRVSDRAVHRRRGGLFAGTAALRPVERVRAQAAAISEDSPAQRLPVTPGTDEITRLGATLNDMLDRLHTALEPDAESRPYSEVPQP